MAKVVGDMGGRPDDWFNQVCAALGLFDGARPESPQRILWDEVLPAIEALKRNNPEAAVLMEENIRAHRLWASALARVVQKKSRDVSSGAQPYVKENR